MMCACAIIFTIMTSSNQLNTATDPVRYTPGQEPLPIDEGFHTTHSDRSENRQALATNLGWFLLLLLLAAVALSTALQYNLGAYAHDAAAEHVPRALVFSGAVSDGFLLPRWVQFLHVGLGSPLFTFQPPLPYFGMDLLARFGLGHPVGWRIIIGLPVRALCSAQQPGTRF